MENKNDNDARCDYNDPESVVHAFIAAMNQWERDAWQAMRAVRDSDQPASYQAETLRKLHAVFAAYCTSRKRPYGRQGSFQNPPEYDPQNETVHSSSVEKSRASVDTIRNAILAGGRHRYILHRQAGQWRIDSVKHEHDGNWEISIL